MNTYADTLRREADALVAAIPHLAETYDAALPHLICRSPVLFSGMGKSGIIAQKAASTFRSLGVPSHYLHPGDASHGDLGCIHEDAVMVLISNSGETPELADLILFCRQHKVPIIAITGRRSSSLADAAQAVLCYGEVQEVCPIGLAPTTSTTASLAVCDALAVDVSRALNVTPSVFRAYHPGGKLGARLKTAKMIMQSPINRVHVSAPFASVVSGLMGTVPGLVLVEDEFRQVLGVITDGDLRRTMETRAPGDLMRVTAFDMMTPDYLHVPPDMRAEEVIDFMNKHRITKVVVRKAKDIKVLGAINLHDAMRGL